MRKKIFLIFLIIILILTIYPAINLASTLEEVILKLNNHRYVNGEEKRGYAYNTSGYDIGKGHKIIFQIMDNMNSKKSNYYSLNAVSGTTSNSKNVGTDIFYKSYYDLNLKGENQETEELKNDIDVAYSKIAGEYFNQIWWLLNNIYVPTGKSDVDARKKEKILSNAGIVLSDITKENSEEVLGNAYKYIPQNGVDYTLNNEGVNENAITDKEQAIKGWYYYTPENSFTRVDITDELIEVAEQASIWYYTNYLNVPVEEREEEYNIRKQGLKLLCSTGIDDETILDWEPLTMQDETETNVSEKKIFKGKWLQDQVTILSWYLIDTAQKYADEFTEKNTDEPLTIVNPIEKLNIQSKHIVNNNNSYIIGPIQINENISNIYKLNDEIKINDIKCEEYNILSREMMQISADKKISDKIGQEFYISVPIDWLEKNVSKSEDGTRNFLVEFSGTYNFNEKKLRKNETMVEQPVVEITPVEKNFTLSIETVIDDKNPPRELEGEFDLALKNYIEKVYSKGELKEKRKEPEINIDKIESGMEKTANYITDKTPVKVKRGDYVVYNFTVYNEGNIEGIVNKITNNIPKGLQFVYIAEDGETVIASNSNGDSEMLTVDTKIYDLIDEYNTYWALDASETGLLNDTYNGENNISVSCDVESFLGTKKVLKPYDKEGLDKLSVKLVLRVEAEDETEAVIRNEAAITDAEDSNGRKQDLLDEQGNKILQDRDSEVNNWLGKDGEKLYQDDEDYENVFLGTIDLALTKFIIAVSPDLTIEDGEYITENKNIGNNDNPYLRASEIDTTELKNSIESHDAKYTLDKTPILIPANSYVLYNIRIYNEGGTDLYAGEITDKLPENLDYVDCTFNRQFKWNLEADGKTIKTDYLSYNKDNENNLLKAFDKEKDDGKGSNLDYKDIQILCKINDTAPSGQTLKNTAEITKYQDEDGKILEKDEDSMSNNAEIADEDDSDYEQVLVQTFDLSLSKFVSIIYVTENEKTRTTTTGNNGSETDITPKVEIDRKKLQDTVVKIGYRIKVTNEGDISGYAKEITDYVPEGLKFYDEDNSGWIDNGNNVVSTKLLESKLLKPGESAEVTIILRWINDKDNLDIKTNLAEITLTENEYKISDRDSVLGNKNEKEDDMDNADVLFAISTGITISIKTILFILIGVGVFILILYLWVKLVKNI